jgi:hypothetical protein
MNATTVIREFWFPIVLAVALLAGVIYVLRAARRWDSLHADDEEVIDPEIAPLENARVPRSGPARIIVATFSLAFLALILYSPRPALVHAAPMDYLIVAIVAGAIVFGFVRLDERLGANEKPPLTSLVLLFAFAAAGLSWILLVANALLDPGPPRNFNTVVADEHCGSKSSHLTVSAPGLPVVGGTMRVNVSYSVCRAAGDGSPMVVVIGPGYFGRAWVQETRPGKVASPSLERR